MDQQNIPPELYTMLGGDTYDFIVKSERAVPLGQALSPMLFGFVWLLITGCLFTAFIGPIFMGNEVHFKSNGVETVAGPQNLEPLLFPISFISIFFLIGLAVFGNGLYLLFAKGPWYIGKEKELIVYKKNKIRTISYEQFSGDSEVGGDPQKGTITLQLRTGKMVSQKNRADRYVPDKIYIAGIQNALQVEQVLKKRIKENDPTPSTTVDSSGLIA